jgi:hypothetical protein
MNRKKRGRPYRIAKSYVIFLAVIRYLFSLGYGGTDKLYLCLLRLGLWPYRCQCYCCDLSIPRPFLLSSNLPFHCRP